MTLGTSRIIAAAACVAACGVILVAGPLDPPAGPVQSTQLALDDVEPRTPLTSEFVSGSASSVFLISQPGHYYLTRDILAGSGQSGILINSNNVTVDLNGYTIRGLSGSFDGISTSGTRSDIVIRNGFITSQTVGIRLQGSSRRVLIEDITINNAGDDGIQGSADTIVRNCNIIAQRDGIDLAGRCRIEDCEIFANDDGIRGGGLMTVRNNFIRAAQDGSGDGVDVEFDSVVDGNVIFVATGRGIRAVQSRISNNVIDGNGTGIVGSGITTGNTVSAFDVGITQSGGVITGNHIQQTTSAAIEASSCLVEGNSINIRVETGIRALNSVTIVGNTINDEDGAMPGGGTTGIFVASNFVTIENNTLSDLGVGIAGVANRRAIVRGNTALNVGNAYPIALNAGNAVAPIEVFNAGSTTIASTSPFANFDFQP